MYLNPMNLKVTIGNLELNNPVMTASGTFGYGEEYSRFFDINALGAVVTKGISLFPSHGNPPPRIVETPSGMLNAIGLHNVGFDLFVRDKLPFLKGVSTPVIVNFFGTTFQEYGELAARLNDTEGIAALEVNISCPNISEGGIRFGCDSAAAFKVTDVVRKNSSLPVIVKLTPNVTDITEIAKAVEAAGADAVSLTNTFNAMLIDVESCTPVLANITGGLSGPAIFPVSLRMVWQVVQKVSIPVIGIGGIMQAEDALQYLIAGAKAVQVGTGLFSTPDLPVKIIDGIKAYMTRKNISDIDQVIGSLRTEVEK